jgi:hypothetical protein
MHKYIPRSPQHRYVRQTLQTARANPRIRGVKRTMNRQGSVRDIKIRAVCERHYNNGWMSRFETHIKPILTPLLKGEVAVLTEEAQRSLAAWLTMKVMVAEAAERDSMYTTQSEHTYLMEHLKAPPNWRLWIARHNGRVWASSYVRQAITIGIVKDGLPPEPPDRSVAKNVQFVTLGLGQLPVLITSTTVPDLEIKPADQILRVMRQLWPYRAGFLWPPGAILTDNDAETLTASFDRTISSPGFEWVARP